MKNVKKQDAEGSVTNMHCWVCESLILRFGAFKKEFPDFKELRFIGEWKQGKVELKPLLNPDGIQIGWIVERCRCDNCGKFTKFIILFDAKDKMLVKR